MSQEPATANYVSVETDKPETEPRPQWGCRNNHRTVRDNSQNNIMYLLTQSNPQGAVRNKNQEGPTVQDGLKEQSNGPCGVHTTQTHTPITHG